MYSGHMVSQQTLNTKGRKEEMRKGREGQGGRNGGRGERKKERLRERRGEDEGG